VRALLLLICLSLAACESGVTSSAADKEKKQIDCAQSYLVLGLPGNYQCERFGAGNVTNGENPYTGMYQSFNIFGTTDSSITLSLQVAKALDRVYFNPNSNPNFSAEKTIPTLPYTAVKQATGWSPPKQIDGATVRSFTNAGRSCFALVKFGGLVAHGGYDYQLTGYFCRKSPIFADEQIATLLSQVIVRSSLSSPLPAAMLPKPLITCELTAGSSFETANEAGCIKMGGHIRPL
jgi:hypothetical protein